VGLTTPQALKQYCTLPLLTILLLGFSSGLPLALTVGTLSYWLAEVHVNKAAIGLFAIIGLPYTLKFLWSPLMDNLSIPVLSRLLGRRRSWILVTQLLLVAAITLLAFTEPQINPFLTALAALFLVFMSASQDIVIDAYRIELATPETQGQAAAMIQLGYRLGMLVSGAGALYMATWLGWWGAYMSMGCIMGLCTLITLFVCKDIVVDTPQESPSLKAWLITAVVNPFAEFTERSYWWLILIFIMLFALADALLGRMANPFFYDMGFSKIQVANIVKVYGTLATILGTFIGGALVRKYGTLRILFVVGFLHALTNLLYMAQSYMGPDTTFLAFSITAENITGGIGAAAFVAYLSGLCNLHYTATQYALLSSLASLARTCIASPAGFIVNALGWGGFFIFSALLALPGLGVLWILNKKLKATSLPAAVT